MVNPATVMELWSGDPPTPARVWLRDRAAEDLDADQSPRRSV